MFLSGCLIEYLDFNSCKSTNTAGLSFVSACVLNLSTALGPPLGGVLLGSVLLGCLPSERSREFGL